MDSEIARLAGAQHGVIARRQLAALGIGRGAIEVRVRRGSLLRVHRGVYAVGHRRLSQQGRWLAAVLAAGAGAALSHRDAAALHGLRPAPRAARVSVTTAAHVRPMPGLWLHARRLLAAADVHVLDAIPVTSVARTLVDLASQLTAAQLASTLGEADRRGVLDAAAAEGVLARVRGRHGQGAARLRAALDAHARAGAVLARSALEELFLDLVLRSGLPRPQLNARVAGLEVDALWPAERVIVELDGWAHHRGLDAGARDRRKTNRLQLRGFVVLRFLHGDVVHRSGQVVRELQAALSRRDG